MSFSSIAAVKAGLRPPQFFPRSFFSNAANATGHIKTSWPGAPSNGTYDTTLPGVALSGPHSAGILLPAPPSGLKNYLARLSMASSQSSTATSWLCLICDRLWHNGGINSGITTAQAVNSVAFPARDENGSTNGVGVFLAVEHSTSQTIGSVPVTTVSYTNSAGVSGRTATNSLHPFAAHSQTATTFLDLQSGDVGVRSVQSITINPAYTTGTLNLVAYRLIAAVPVIGGVGLIDPVTGCLPKVFDDAVLFYYSITGSSNADGSLGSMTNRLDLAAG